MINIIYITSRRLLPLDSGDKLLTYNLLKHMTNYNIHLLNLNEGDEYLNNETSDISHISKSFNSFSFQNKHSIYKFIKSILFNKMYWKLKLRNTEIETKVENFINQYDDVDIIVWDHLRSSIFFVENNKKNILIEHNNEYVAIQSRFTKTKNIILKYFFNKQAKIMKNYIVDIHAKMDKIIYLSKDDFLTLKKENPNKYQLMNQLLLDFQHQPYKVKNINQKIKLLFIGSLDWYPNIEAIKWFLTDIFPKLNKNNLYEFNIVGRNPSKELKKYIATHSNTLLHANVPSVEKFYLNSDVLIAPIQNGSGINIKILEALSYSIPIVMTSFAKRGYDDLDFLSNADTAQNFIDEINRLKSIKSRRKLHALEMDYYKKYKETSKETMNHLFS